MSEIPEVFAMFEQKLAHVLSFTIIAQRNNTKQAIEELLAYFSGIVERASKAEARSAELEAERRWIPVSERLPKENAPVLVLTVLGGMFVDFIHGKSVVTGNPDFYELDVEDVTHWMPLPKLPEVQE